MKLLNRRICRGIPVLLRRINCLLRKNKIFNGQNAFGFVLFYTLIKIRKFIKSLVTALKP